MERLCNASFLSSHEGKMASSKIEGQLVKSITNMTHMSALFPAWSIGAFFRTLQGRSSRYF